MNYAEAVRWLLSFADFERSGQFRERPDVGPVLALLARLGDPHLGRRTVHIAGSKGKGSVAAMVESVLREAGYVTGLFTSPHLHSYRERIQVNGEPVSPEGFAHQAATVRRAVEELDAGLGERSFVTFDLFTVMAFLAFRDAGVDAQVVEAGLGGRLDSTNVFESKDVACITPISLEHTKILGNTPEAIAREKAAIITPRCSAVMAPQPFREAAAVIREASAAAGAPLVDVAGALQWHTVPQGVRGQDIGIVGPGFGIRARVPLLGAHQAENAATAVACIVALRERGFEVPDEAIAEGLAAVRWPGRLEVLREEPLVLADGAHNRESARRLRECLVEVFEASEVTFIVGSSADKDVAGLAAELAPVAGQAFAVRAGHPRAMAADEVARAFRAAGVRTKVVDNVGAAIEVALAEARTGGVICLTGSLFVAAEGREQLGIAKREEI